MPVIGNSYIFLVAICMIVVSIDKTNGQYFQNKPCKTQTGIRGICVPVTSCSNILNLLTLSIKPLPNSVVNFVRKAHCGTFSNTHYVCCDPKLIINQKTTQVPPIIMRRSGFEKMESEVEVNHNNDHVDVVNEKRSEVEVKSDDHDNIATDHVDLVTEKPTDFEKLETEVEVKSNDSDNITDHVNVVTEKRSEKLKTEVEVKSDEHDNITTDHVDVVPEKPSSFEKLESAVKVKKDDLDTTTDHDYVVVPEKISSGNDLNLSASAWITILVYFIYLFC